MVLARGRLAYDMIEQWLSGILEWCVVRDRVAIVGVLYQNGGWGSGWVKIYPTHDAYNFLTIDVLGKA
jgi:hypothetical protein